MFKSIAYDVRQTTSFVQAYRANIQQRVYDLTKDVFFMLILMRSIEIGFQLDRSILTGQWSIGTETDKQRKVDNSKHSLLYRATYI